MIEEFHYQIPWRSQSAHPGRHASSHYGGEYEFHGHAPLISRPEPHNLDIHASLLDPFQQYMVRTFRQRGLITVCLIADLSASMGFQNKMQTLAQFTNLVAFSSYRSGDHFSFLGCGQELLPDFHLPARWYKGGVPEFAESISRYHPTSVNCNALQNISDHCPRQRSLIFFVSDFHFSLEYTEMVFSSLLKHDVIPVILWRPEEYQTLPRWGLIRLQDPETGKNRQLFMRPALKNKITDHFKQRLNSLRELCLRYGRQPFVLDADFKPDQLTRYFYE